MGTGTALPDLGGGGSLGMPGNVWQSSPHSELSSGWVPSNWLQREAEVGPDQVSRERHEICSPRCHSLPRSLGWDAQVHKPNGSRVAGLGWCIFGSGHGHISFGIDKRREKKKAKRTRGKCGHALVLASQVAAQAQRHAPFWAVCWVQ